MNEQDRYMLGEKITNWLLIFILLCGVVGLGKLCADGMQHLDAPPVADGPSRLE